MIKAVVEMVPHSLTGLKASRRNSEGMEFEHAKETVYHETTIERFKRATRARYYCLLSLSNCTGAARCW